MSTLRFYAKVAFETAVVSALLVVRQAMLWLRERLAKR